MTHSSIIEFKRVSIECFANVCRQRWDGAVRTSNFQLFNKWGTKLVSLLLLLLFLLFFFFFLRMLEIFVFLYFAYIFLSYLTINKEDDVVHKFTSFELPEDWFLTKGNIFLCYYYLSFLQFLFVIFQSLKLRNVTSFRPSIYRLLLSNHSN